MDFHALPRRDLQALCKRNGVRANIANAAMADALSALPKVDGVEEYMKQAAAVPEPAAKVAVAEEEVRREKQGSPLPRGRRVTAKTTEVVKPDEGKGKEPQKVDAKQETKREDDEAALAVGRRGPSRRTRPAPAVAAPTTKAAADPEPAAKAAVAEEEVRREKQGSPLPRGRRVTAKTTEIVKPDEGKGKEPQKADAKQEINREEDETALGVGRRGPSRRARPAPCVGVPTDKAAVEKTSETVKPGKGKEGETDLNQEAATGVVRRDASRRARPAPAAAAPATKEAAVEKQSPPPRPPRPEDGVKEDPKFEANKEDAPIQGAVRRGPSRRARAAVSASTAEPETKAAALQEQEKQGNPFPRARRVTSTQPEPARPDDNVEEKNKKHEKDNDDVLAQGVGRRGPSRRARQAPDISEPGAKAAVERPAIRSELEQLGIPPPRGRRMTIYVRSSAPITTDGDEANNGDMQREANKGTAPDLGAGRRGARGRARPEPAVHAPAGKVAADEDAPIPRGRRGKAKQPEVITLDSDEEEDKDKLMLEGKEEGVPAHGAVRRGPSRHTRPAPIEAPATKGTDAPVEAVIVRPARVRKLTVKAVAAEEKVLRRTTRKAAATISTLQNKKSHDEPQETCYDLEDVKDAADPQNIEQSQQLDQPKQDDQETCYELEDVKDTADPKNIEQSQQLDQPMHGDQEGPMNEDEIVMEPRVVRPTCMPKTTMQAAAVAEEKVPGRTRMKAAVSARNCTLQKEKQQESQEAVPALASDEPCYNLEYIEEAADLQTVVIDGPKKDDEKDVLMNQDEMLMEMTPTDERHVTDEMLLEETLEEPPVIDQECMEKSQVEEQQVDVEPCATLPGLEDSPVMGVDQIVENEEDEDAHVQEGSERTVGQLDKEMDEENHPTGKEMQTVPIIQTVLAPFITSVPVTEVCFTTHADHDGEIESSNSLETPSIDAEDGPICQEKRDVAEDDEEAQPKMPPVTEILMEESLEEEPAVVDQESTSNLAMEEQECKDKSLVEEQLVDVKPCATLPNLEDSPIFGLVYMFAEQTVDNEEDEGAHLQEGSGPTDGRLDKELNEENHHTGKEMEMIPVIQTLQVPLIAADPATEFGFTAHADHGNEMKSSNGLETALVAAEDCVICQEKRDVAEDDAEARPNMVDEVVVLDCSRNISSVVEDNAVETMVSEQVQNEVIISNNVAQAEGSGMEKVEQVTEELTRDLAEFFAEDSLVCQEKRDVAEDTVEVQPLMVDDAVVLDCSGNISSAGEEKAVETMVSELVQNDVVISNNVAQATLIDGGGSSTEKVEQMTEELTWGFAQYFEEDVAEDNVEVQPNIVHEAVALDCSGNISSVVEEKAVQTMVSELVHNEVVIINNVTQVSLIDGEGAGMEKTELLTEDQTHSSAQLYGDVEGDDFQTDIIHVDELKEVDEEKKAIEVTEKIPQSMGTVDDHIQECYFQFGCVHDDELKKVITAENVLELSETEDVWKESAFTSDCPSELGIASDYTDNITSALLDDITGTLSKITITEQTCSTDDNSSEDTAKSVCKSNTDESVFKNRGENKVAKQVAMQENMGGKVANKSAELNKLSMRQLKAKIKKTLEEKRVALGMVDGNVCRSNATGQQQVGNLH